MRTLSRMALVRMSVGQVETRFQLDAAGWLPQPLMYRYGRFETYVWLWQVGVLVDCWAGLPWVRPGSTWRRIVVEPAGGPLGWLLPEVDGGLVVGPHPDGEAALRFEGGWRPPATVSGHLGLARFFVRAVVDGLLDEVAERLVSPGGLPPVPGPSGLSPSSSSAEWSSRG